jgi:ATP-binding cassette subfamily B protein
LKDINIKIPKGSRVGFIGITGSGKSTLLDIAMGLLEPTDGELEVDGLTILPSNQRFWQAHIAHVPQSIFLADASIAENIAFGIPTDQIDWDRVRLASEKAQMADTIESWQEKYRTLVGERGVRLSGGQRQRIGIARALYKNAKIIIFDEATSALDAETENEIMKTIDCLSKNMTLFIISHKESMLNNCDIIIRMMSNGNYQVKVNSMK